LSENIWYDKILLDHYELHGNEESIELTVGDPDVHNRDKVHADREVYYRLGALPVPYDRFYLKVVVAYSAADDGQSIGSVITAYTVEGIPSGERPIWKRASHRR
jgi:hypothetical protein